MQVRAALLSPPDVRVTVPVVGIADFSSRGPMEDKRIKPDVMAPGTGITSAASDGSLSSTNECSSTDVVEMSGTSMATPIVAGAAGIVRQYFEEGRLMNGMRDALAKRSFSPSAALVKALIIHSGTSLIEDSFGMGTGSEVRSLRPHIFVA
jgi:subtilisin family serine protease